MQLSSVIVVFNSFYDGLVDMQIWAPVTRSQCKVSDIQVTIKAFGPLIYYTFTNEIDILLVGNLPLSKISDSHCFSQCAIYEVVV